jgi:hypothetical protein
MRRDTCDCQRAEGRRHSHLQSCQHQHTDALYNHTAPHHCESPTGNSAPFAPAAFAQQQKQAERQLCHRIFYMWQSSGQLRSPGHQRPTHQPRHPKPAMSRSNTDCAPPMHRSTTAGIRKKRHRSCLQCKVLAVAALPACCRHTPHRHPHRQPAGALAPAHVRGVAVQRQRR